MHVVYEIIGYCGTALVLCSMLMTSVVKLRVLNACGSVFSVIYAYVTHTWPVLILNACLLMINIFQLVLLRRKKAAFHLETAQIQDRSLQHFLNYYKNDIGIYFPELKQMPDRGEVYIVYHDVEPAGILIGDREGSTIRVALDYTTPKYRDCSVASYLFGQLKEQGITTLIAQSNTAAHYRYLDKMGFKLQGEERIKSL